MNYPNNYPYQTYQPYQQPMITCIPVASFEEARAVQTDFSGQPKVMLDAAHGCIYVKYFNQSSGMSEISVYKKVVEQPPLPITDIGQYVNRIEALEAKVNNILSAKEAPHESI